MKRWQRVALIAVAVVLFLVLVGPFLVPVPPLEDTVPSEQLADADSRFVTADGVRIHYKTAGEGEPTLILLHGFAASVFSWREVIDPLAEQATVIAFDRPASGLTERPMPGEWQGESPYSAASQSDQTVGLMDALGVDQAVLIGNSAGGAVATYTALRYPDRIRALVLVDAAIYRGEGSPTWILPLLRTPQMRRLGPLFVRSIRNWGQDFGRSAWHDPSRLTQEIWEGYTRPLRVNDWDRALWELGIAGPSPDLAARLDQLTLPVLVITGDDDQIVPTEESIRLADELSNAALVVIPNCGHVPQEECPEAFLAAVEGFLADLP
ncbi:MAG: alpha/beta hydrolase [Anaerolineae bacterium]|jgi:pimeloyl-ACP methyl ester carboxylesterase